MVHPELLPKAILMLSVYLIRRRQYRLSPLFLEVIVLKRRNMSRTKFLAAAGRWTLYRNLGQADPCGGGLAGTEPRVHGQEQLVETHIVLDAPPAPAAVSHTEVHD